MWTATRTNFVILPRESQIGLQLNTTDEQFVNHIDVHVDKIKVSYRIFRFHRKTKSETEDMNGP